MNQPATPQSSKPGNTDIRVDFMSMLVHQLSTPLAIMHWNAELLRKSKMSKPLDAAQTEFVNGILDGAKHMGALLEGMQTASHLDRDIYDDDPALTDIATILQQAQAELAPKIDAKHLKSTSAIASNLPQLQVRPSLLRYVVQNLLTNAVAFTPDNGSVAVELRLATAEETSRLEGQGSALLLRVTDTGYGIPADALPHIYEKLFRADNIRALGLAGPGLGLYIAATAVTKLRGAIWCESTENQGTTFFALFPVAAPSPES
jgi:signal transduction histidine kinase